MIASVDHLAFIPVNVVIGWFVYASIIGQLGRKRQTRISATALGVSQRF